MKNIESLKPKKVQFNLASGHLKKASIKGGDWWKGTYWIKKTLGNGKSSWRKTQKQENYTWNEERGVAVCTLERGDARPPRVRTASLSQLSLLPLLRGPTPSKPEEAVRALLQERFEEGRRGPRLTGSCSSSASDPDVTASILFSPWAYHPPNEISLSLSLSLSFFLSS